MYKNFIHGLSATATVLLFASSVLASDQFVGSWNRISYSFVVTVESWDEACGTKPKSYYNDTLRPTEIIRSGKHLIFLSGGLRTDQCNSPNPRVQSISESVQADSWKRVCQTPPGDSKSEHVEYTLQASDQDTLAYVSRSRFDWSLEKARCVAIWQEKRLYKRAEVGGESPIVDKEKSPIIDNSDSPILRVHETPDSKSNPSGPEKPLCVPSGPAVSLALSPAHQKLQPLGKACLRVAALDSHGCEFSPSVTYTVTQSGQKIAGLISRSGCFTAGSNAADSEGTYEITAKIGKLTATAAIEVAFPDLSDLAQAKLDLSEEVGTAEKPAAAVALKSPADSATSPSVALPAPIRHPDPPKSSVATILIAAIVSIGAIVVCVLLILFVRHQNRSRARRASLIPAKSAPSAPKAPAGRTCPKCSSRFPADATFCPHDGSALKDDPSSENPISPQGMICPTCHRGYDRDARFCPHDAGRLVRYSEWRNR